MYIYIYIRNKLLKLLEFKKLLTFFRYGSVSMPDTKCLEASPFVPTGCVNAIEQRLGMVGQCQVQL